jgi:hypothetical protein
MLVACAVAAVLMLTGCDKVVRMIGTAPDASIVRAEACTIGADPTGENVDRSGPDGSGGGAGAAELSSASSASQN